MEHINDCKLQMGKTYWKSDDKNIVIEIEIKQSEIWLDKLDSRIAEIESQISTQKLEPIEIDEKLDTKIKDVLEIHNAEIGKSKSMDSVLIEELDRLKGIKDGCSV